jgi:hypothetical protein
MKLRHLLAVAAAATVGVMAFAGNGSAAPLPTITNCVTSASVTDAFVSGGRQVTATFSIAPGCTNVTVTLAAYTKAAPGRVFPQSLINTATGTFSTGGPFTLQFIVPSCGFHQYDLFEDIAPADLPNPLTVANEPTVGGHTYLRAFEFSDFACSPGGSGTPLTIGFWKNHSSCSPSNGGQAFVLDSTLAHAPITVGRVILTGSSCTQAYAILNKSDFNGVKRASDPAYNLAAQFLAAQLNLASGATSCSNVLNAVAQAQQLLFDVNFTGVGPTTMSAAQAAQANSLASFFDAYNNGQAVC